MEAEGDWLVRQYSNARLARWTAGCAALLLSACTATGQSDSAEEIPEIRPGVLQGYLPMDRPVESKLFVPPPPAPGSARQAADKTIARRLQELEGTPRWELAARDAELAFPQSAEIFSCSLGLPITEQDTPDLYMLLRRTMADVGLATYSAKDAYQRERPFMINGGAICTPEDEAFLREDGSYPSGHTSLGWGWALILAELAPERAETIVARGRAFGESRNVCNVHWYSDVVAGRMVGATAVALLHDNEEFLTAMAAARADIARARKAGLQPLRDCAAEARILETPLE